MNELRIFEVVGASEPGPRCRFSLRDPGRDPGRAGVLRVSGPPELCPLASGEGVALLARSLQGDPIAGALGERRELDLGRGSVLWRRQPGPRSLPARLRHRYWAWVAGQRQRAWVSSRGEPRAGLAVAIGLGLRDALPPEQRRQLRAAGLGHLVAVSGMHVAVAALWLLALARRMAALVGRSPRVATVLAWLPLLAYVGLTGAPASAVRAAAMLMAFELSVVVGRPAHGPTLLACTAAAMLLWCPAWAVDPGFQLSVAAMAAIVSAPRELGPLAMSWRIGWVCAPLSVLHFGAAPLHGLIGNALALPLFALLMPTALAGTLSLGVLGPAALAPAELLAAPILALAELLGQLPGLGPWPLAALALLVLLAHRVARRRRRTPSNWLPPRLACALALVPALLTVGVGPDQPVERPRFEWVALGSVASRSLLVADPSQPRAACLYRPTRSATAWIGLLARLEVDTLTRIDARLPAADRPEPRSDPRVRALVERLAGAGLTVTAGRDRCRPPEAADVREALRACRFRHGGRGQALVRARRAGLLSEVDCWVEDRWVTMPELRHTLAADGRDRRPDDRAQP